MLSFYFFPFLMYINAALWQQTKDMQCSLRNADWTEFVYKDKK